VSLPDGLHIRRFDVATASDSELAALTLYSNRVLPESRPDRQPITVEEFRSSALTRPSWVVSHDWYVWRGDEVLAGAYLRAARTGENQGFADFWIGVLPEVRRRGIATELFRLIAGAAEGEGRQVLLTSTTSHVEAGERFLRSFGAEVVQSWSRHRLSMAEVSLEAVRVWLKRGGALRDEFELGLWEGPYPDEDLAAVARMLEVMNTQPRGELEVEDVHYTPDQLRDRDAALVARGQERWVIYVRHASSREIAGYTEVTWDPAHPELLEQGDTGVFPNYRNRGLARWLKAEMLTKIMAERPRVAFILTGMDTSNSSMLRINEELGFKPLVSALGWQLDLDTLRRRLADRR
jgi:GNAT superfamily N-acetyltransferase